ncbi:hypothetical protein DRP04_04950 [Archaeoglobales archaeon]|nr:MAG: hypothetical protein DRP04_04950 [Archaeoglobales archaeon]
MEVREIALKIKTDYAVAWYNKGLALYNLGKLEEAVECYDRALEINPNLNWQRGIRK